MKILGKILNLIFKLPEPIKQKMAGGKSVYIRGNTLNIDNQILANNSAKGPQFHNMAPEKARSVFKSMTALIQGDFPSQVKTSELSIPVDSYRMAARLYTHAKLITNPPKESTIMIYYHGGGVVIGDLDSYDVVCGRLAQQLNIRVLSVDYRLAPEHKFPAAAHDAYAAFLWVQKNANTLNVNPEHILLGGDSAGGYLSAVTSLQAIQNQQPLPKGQLLVYPMADLSTQRESYQLFGEELVLTKSLMNYFINHYINSEEDKTNPLCSPLLASDDELKQMPSTIITLAGFDPLYDEGMAFYEKLKSLGVKTELLEHKDLTHGFITMTGALKRGNDALNEIIDACRSFLK